MCPKCASSTQSTSQIQYTLAKMALPRFFIPKKSPAKRERERERKLGHWNNFFPPERAVKNICALQVVLLFKLKLFSTQSGNKFPCSSSASVISTGALVERHTVALFERLSRQSECFWASGGRRRGTYKRSSAAVTCKFESQCARGANKSRCDFSPRADSL